MKKILLSSLIGASLIFGNLYAKEKAFNPFEQMQKMQQQVDKIFAEFQNKMLQDDEFKKFDLSFANEPAMDLEDLGKSYRIRLNIPGAKESKINIKVKDGVLKVTATTSKEEEKKSSNFIKKERFSGSYEKMITLPKDVDAQKLKSSYKDGVLEIVIPKK
jgi:HSP20 family protein